eukprot:707245_1
MVKSNTAKFAKVLDSMTYGQANADMKLFNGVMQKIGAIWIKPMVDILDEKKLFGDMVKNMILLYREKFIGAVRAVFKEDDSRIKSAFKVTSWTDAEMLEIVGSGKLSSFLETLAREHKKKFNTFIFLLIEPVCDSLAEDPVMFQHMVGLMISVPRRVAFRDAVRANFKDDGSRIQSCLLRLFPKELNEAPWANEEMLTMIT